MGDQDASWSDLASSLAADWSSFWYVIYMAGMHHTPVKLILVPSHSNAMA